MCSTIIQSVDTQESDAIDLLKIVNPSNIDLNIDKRREIDRFLPKLSKFGSSYKLVQKMIGCDNASTAHSYICKFSRQHNISSMTYKNMLCKVHIICGKLKIYEYFWTNDISLY